MALDPNRPIDFKTITPYPVFNPQSVTPPPPPPPAAAPAPLASPTQAPTQSQGLAPSSLLDKVIFTIFGTPDSMLPPDKQAQKKQKRGNAGSLAASAATDPGEAFMGIPSGGGNSLDLGSIIKLIGGLFK